MATGTRTDHDALYHRLFSDPRVVAQLLRGFVDGPWLADFDLDGMHRLNAKFHADTGERREGDMVWRIPRRDGQDSYLVLLLEFQSASDTYMALRVLTYAGLLWQHLVREGRLAAGGRLPPLLPVVVYNGQARWHAPLDLHKLVGLVADSPLWPWQPQVQYYLIDVGAFGDAELVAREGLPALWFRLENAVDTDAVVAVADALLAWLGRHPGFAMAQAVFAELLGAMVAPLHPGIRVPRDLLEMRSRLVTRAEQWAQNWKEEGLQAGLETGRQRGLQEGQQRGKAALLLRQIQRRFGTLPAWVTDQVLAADIATLDEWGLRILDANRLEDVVGKPPQGPM
jgi:hypothetical protein